MSRTGSSTANLGTAAAFSSSECKQENKFLGLHLGMQCVSRPADAPLQPWREGQPAVHMGGTVDMGISLEQNIRRSDTHQLVLEQKLGTGPWAESKSSDGLSCGASCRHARSRCKCQWDEELFVPLPLSSGRLQGASLRVQQIWACCFLFPCCQEDLQLVVGKASILIEQNGNGVL